MSHVVRAIPLPGPQNLWSRSLRDLDHRFESSRVRGALRRRIFGTITNGPEHLLTNLLVAKIHPIETDWLQFNPFPIGRGYVKIEEKIDKKVKNRRLYYSI